MDYRDDRGAALARLEQLEAEHHQRLVASVPERRKLLEAERFELLHPPRTSRGFWGGFFRIFVICGMLACVRGDTGFGFPIGLAIASVAFVMLAAWFAFDERETGRRRRRIARVDAALAALDAIHVRIAPTELDAIHVRIAELEEEETEDVSSASRTSR